MTFSRLSYCDLLWNEGASLVTQMVKNLPAMLEIWVRSLGWENPLEKGMATHSSILAWRITRTEEPDGLQAMDRQELDTTGRLTLSLSLEWRMLIYSICWGCLSSLVAGLPWWLRQYRIWLSAGDMGLIPGFRRSPEKDMANHSSILAWRIPWTEEPHGIVHGVAKNQTQLSS